MIRHSIKLGLSERRLVIGIVVALALVTVALLLAATDRVTSSAALTPLLGVVVLHVALEERGRRGTRYRHE